ncbi:hypothetical protein [Limimaricola pyoseonensis]|uniref:Adenylate cyclase, class 3 n=1 Tax=Limimaricola pyoseonensis TaxID=521013 RepID=A0A1G7AKH8_9RHOB|nr:hypothetical protein [Limimaricola pyoseonensis]SDE14515.1 hypothetical protein SAMN04488567_0970 [Limimaricola pyoseonensis]
MTDIDALRFEAAEYRVRLFLSVDLSGSTAFKNSKDGEARETGATPYWVTVFQRFYSDFPGLFAAEFQRQRNDSVGADTCPELWKAVGDELVFCGRVASKKSCAVALDAFIKTLHQYRKRLSDQGVDLNLKGAGWLAAFPEPNRTVQLRARENSPELLPASEALELSADKEPFQFDFLGKAIDTGFRVASRAQPDKFALSVQLARLLVNSGPDLSFGHQIRLERPSILKGVNKNEPYPFLYIDTMEYLPTQAAKQLEREVLREGEVPNPARLSEYLTAYCKVVGTDEITLKVDSAAADVGVPESYSTHKKYISEHLAGERQTEFDGEGIGDGLAPAEEVYLEDASLSPLEAAHEVPGDT